MEKHHIVKALQFELSKVETRKVRQRVLVCAFRNQMFRRSTCDDRKKAPAIVRSVVLSKRPLWAL